MLRAILFAGLYPDKDNRLNPFSFYLGFVAIVFAVSRLLSYLGLPSYLQVALGGVPVEISIWSAVLVILFWGTGWEYLKKYSPSLSQNHALAGAALITATLILSLGLHELAHALVAQALGHPVHRAALTGWGAYVVHEDNIPSWDTIAIALAGPFTNLALAWLARWYVMVKDESVIENSVQYVSVTNMSLFKLNMLPLTFLDGGHAVVAGLSLITPNPVVLNWLPVLIYIITIYAYSMYRKGRVSWDEALAKL